MNYLRCNLHCCFPPLATNHLRCNPLLFLPISPSLPPTHFISSFTLNIHPSSVLPPFPHHSIILSNLNTLHDVMSPSPPPSFHLSPSLSVSSSLLSSMCFLLHPDSKHIKHTTDLLTQHMYVCLIIWKSFCRHKPSRVPCSIWTHVNMFPCTCVLAGMCVCVHVMYAPHINTNVLVQHCNTAGVCGLVVVECALTDSCTMGRNPPQHHSWQWSLHMEVFTMRGKEGGQEHCTMQEYTQLVFLATGELQHCF